MSAKSIMKTDYEPLKCIFREEYGEFRERLKKKGSNKYVPEKWWGLVVPINSSTGYPRLENVNIYIEPKIGKGSPFLCSLSLPLIGVLFLRFFLVKLERTKS